MLNEWIKDMTNWFKYDTKAICLFCLCLLLSLPSYSNQSTIINKIKLLEDDFKSLSSEFYQDASSYSDTSLQKITDINLLLIKVNKLNASNNSISAIQLIYFNLDMVKDNLDTEAVFDIMELLLDKNEWNLANSLFRTIKDDGDKSLLATVQFLFAKYHAQRNEWNQVNKLLEGNFAELSEENAAYAYLLNGSALQHLKKHRQAVSNYNKIKATSQYYNYAQLNTAIANIRQGWWTDAQLKIRSLIKEYNKNNEDELTNRLYLVLGYALLQREYYRDARQAFRNIGLNSRYTNRALLGIGLTATSQGDYIGGLNALTILKDKKTFDLSVDESYLLVPYIYEKLQQENTVTSTYSEAMSYYQKRIKLLNNISNRHSNIFSLEYDKNTSSFIIQNNSLDYGNKFPESFIKNFHKLNELNKASSNIEIKNKITGLTKKYDSIFQEIIKDLTSKREEYLKSYLNQSRYGLARLYDSSSEASDQ
ncbi:MAG: hypothetical protein DIZ80_06875 [endosymbiont of Galathealinum brachiosum]|uniref:Tetratricopeptide repeat-like domain-containing protein n=1 Tax=endosymbiont of Galathealinum brachiosum TaxID=2200906 RepID=A0A370DG23_9GAMM|nr:MAG: hypothetical protein DIZ80_06875 [endosymbiont of Galathealinum brachiosum]